MRYQLYRYLYPPRPETAIAPGSLRLIEAQRWWGQAKLNGTNTTLYVPPDRKSFAMGRHGPDHRLQWQPGERWAAFQGCLPGAGWYVFVGELLHSKGVGVRDTLYLFDLLVDDGDYLLGSSYRERWHRLDRLCAGFPAEPWTETTYTVIAPGVWLAANRARAFAAWFAAICAKPPKTPIEGLVFKDPAAPLLPCVKPTANARWQSKCRRPTDHLSF